MYPILMSGTDYYRDRYTLLPISVDTFNDGMDYPDILLNTGRWMCGFCLCENSATSGACDYCGAGKGRSINGY